MGSVQHPVLLCTHGIRSFLCGTMWPCFVFKQLCCGVYWELKKLNHARRGRGSLRSKSSCEKGNSSPEREFSLVWHLIKEGASRTRIQICCEPPELRGIHKVAVMYYTHARSYMQYILSHIYDIYIYKIYQSNLSPTIIIICCSAVSTESCYSGNRTSPLIFILLVPFWKTHFHIGLTPAA